MKKILNRMAKIGLEIVMYLFEHISQLIGIAILINFVIDKKCNEKIKNEKKGLHSTKNKLVY